MASERTESKHAGFWALRAQWVARFWLLRLAAAATMTAAVAWHWVGTESLLEVPFPGGGITLALVVVAIAVTETVEQRWRRLLKGQLASCGMGGASLTQMLSLQALPGESRAARQALWCARCAAAAYLVWGVLATAIFIGLIVR